MNRTIETKDIPNNKVLQNQRLEKVLEKSSLEIVQMVNQSLRLVRRGNYYGVMDTEGNMLIDCIYDYISAKYSVTLGKIVLQARLGKTELLMDKGGNTIINPVDGFLKLNKGKAMVMDGDGNTMYDLCLN